MGIGNAVHIFLAAVLGLPERYSCVTVGFLIFFSLESIYEILVNFHLSLPFLVGIPRRDSSRAISWVNITPRYISNIHLVPFHLTPANVYGLDKLLLLLSLLSLLLSIHIVFSVFVLCRLLSFRRLLAFSSSLRLEQPYCTTLENFLLCKF